MILVFTINWNTTRNSSGEDYKVQGDSLDAGLKGRIKSGSLATDYNIDTAIKDMTNLKLNTLNVPIAVDIENLSSSHMEVDSESEARAVELIRRLADKRVNIILEPYPWINSGADYAAEWNPKSREEFFANWKNNVLYKIIDEVANPYKVNAIVVASNFVHLEAYEKQWLDIISSVKEKYKGLITYKTSWWYTAKWDGETIKAYQDKLNNKIFSAVDFISIAAYFELTDKKNPRVSELVAAIHRAPLLRRNQNVEAQVRNFYLKWEKPVFFGELGFPNREFAASHPWNPAPSQTVNNLDQANCFEAYKEVFTRKWFLGFSVFGIGEHGENKNYYPREEAQKVIRDWFSQ